MIRNEQSATKCVSCEEERGDGDDTATAGATVPDVNTTTADDDNQKIEAKSCSDDA